MWAVAAVWEILTLYIYALHISVQYFKELLYGWQGQSVCFNVFISPLIIESMPQRDYGKLKQEQAATM